MSTPRPSIRLLIVDDHPVLRAGLANLLALEADFTVVGQAGSGEAALRLAHEVRPDVCLLDLSMPGIGGLETLRRLTVQAAAVRILVLTSSDRGHDANQALAAGAAAFVTKNVDHPEIVRAIRDVHAGKAGIRLGVQPARETAPALTPRELEVLHLLRKGCSNAGIGRSLGITERTAKFHVISILEKLAAPDRAGAVARAFDMGILRATVTPPLT
jgi:DNA-binding NarL/FixJ family response regulator